jgi:hypothetical protein
MIGALVGAALPLVLVVGPVRGEDAAPKAQYVGAETCAKFCHKTAKQGEQLKIWQESAHAKAYETLGTDAAKAIAKKQGIDDPQKSDKCLKCHTTAYGASADQLASTYSIEEGIGCERCHGPGSNYKKMGIMKDKEKAIAAGLIIPDEKVCVQCHNENSPTHKVFKYDEYFKKIAHMIPKKSDG